MLSYLFLLPFIFSTASASDLDALRRLTATKGRTLLWNFSDPTPCFWHGIHCNPAGDVTELRLPGAGLSGEIPLSSVGNLTHLRVLSLRSNSLSGPLPSDLSFCTDLRDLFLQDNNLSGGIPATLFSLNSLSRLSLSGNRLSGELLPGFNNLTQLRILYLQNNNLSGSIPQLENLTNLQKFNVSYNKLKGSIPSILQKFNSDSFINTSLCGSPLSPCPSGRNGGSDLSAGAIAGIVVGSVVGLILILLIFLIIWRRSRTAQQTTRPRDDTSLAASSAEMEPVAPKPSLESESRASTKPSENGEIVEDDGLVFLREGGLRFSLEELLRASAEVLGKGTLGSSYRVYLEGRAAEEVVVVVKRLRHVCVEEREFRERVVGLGRLRHENLMGVKGYYYGREEKLLLFDSLPMGSLAALLHGKGSASTTPLTWKARTKIAYGAARGICYLHSRGPTFSHGNIKSSNILLTDGCTPRVSEFCINQLVFTASTHGHGDCCAPEVTDTRRVSQKGDVYSFGVVLLELVTGKAPASTSPGEGGPDLPRWVQSVIQEMGTRGVLDEELVRHQDQYIEDMVAILQLALECTYIYPDRRPIMAEVMNRIDGIGHQSKRYLGD